jgi:hypothetical protein
MEFACFSGSLSAYFNPYLRLCFRFSSNGASLPSTRRLLFHISPRSSIPFFMADLYPASYHPRQQHPQSYHPRDSQSYQLNQQPSSLSYPAIMTSQQNQQQAAQQPPPPPPPSGSISPDDEHPQKQSDPSTTPKPDQPGHSKPQATFLTKLYA